MEPDNSALHIIILGSRGGPLESNCTAFLIRSVASNWSKGSVIAVDAGVHLGAIAALLERSQPAGLGDKIPLPHKLTSGPFAGLELPFASAGANAAHFGRTMVDTYLITHPHLDHISGFVINTAAQPGTRPKRLAGLPSTIHAFKTHIFNSVIWPNLSDENNGAGLVTYMRLVEGGSPAMGHGVNKGYVEMTDGLAVKVWSVSHGHCMEKHSHRGSICGANMGAYRGRLSSARYPSVDGSYHHSPRSRRPTHNPDGGLHLQLPPPANGSPASVPTTTTTTTTTTVTTTTTGHGPPRQLSVITSHPPSSYRPPASLSACSASSGTERVCVYDSSAYFIRDISTGREVLIFGDVEPDSVSLSPRNYIVWREAAPKIAAGTLAAILIECSFDNGQAVERLYGHLKPDLLMEELWALGSEVEAVRNAERIANMASKKRKLGVVEEDEGTGSSESGNTSGGSEGIVTRDGVRRRTLAISTPRSRDPHPPSYTSHPNTTYRPTADDDGDDDDDDDSDAVSPKTIKPPHFRLTSPPPPPGQPSPMLSGSTAMLSLHDGPPTPPLQKFSSAPLRGVKVVVIHVKDKLDDGPDAGETILEELLEEEAEMQSGAEFIVSRVGQSFYV
jgi:cAMP phosphodiesterase